MEMKLKSSAKKKLLVDGGILYRQTDKFYSFRQRHCISIDLTDGTKLGNGFTGLIDYAITHHYPINNWPHDIYGG